MTNILLETSLDIFFACDMAGRIQSVHLRRYPGAYPVRDTKGVLVHHYPFLTDPV